jgi:hypothetical protein
MNGRDKMNLPANELRIKLNRQMFVSLIEMVKEATLSFGESEAEALKTIETHACQILEGVIADYRLRQHLNKSSATKPKETDYTTKPADSTASHGSNRQLLPQTIQRILHAYESDHLTCSELSQRFAVSKSCIARILAGHEQAIHVKTPQRGNRTRGTLPAFALSSQQRQQS